MITFPGFKVDCEFNNCVLYVPYLTTPTMWLLYRASSASWIVAVMLSPMSCKALNLWIAAALPFSASYLHIVFTFCAIVRHTMITGNCSLHRLVYLLGNAGQQSCFVKSWKLVTGNRLHVAKMLIFDCSCKVALTCGSRAQNQSIGNNNCVLIMALLD